jgi:glycosyltransferase involved in cell wall biosynthesis
VATSGPERSTRHDPFDIRVEHFATTGADYLLNPLRGDVEGYRRFLTTEPFDVLVMHGWQTWTTDVALLDLAAIKSRKFVYSHCLSTSIWLGYKPLRSLALRLFWSPYMWALPRRMRQLDGVIVLAEEGSDSRFGDVEVAKRARVPVHVIPNSSSQPVVTVDAERSQIIAVGSYTRVKGFDFVLDAYARSSARNVIPLSLFGQSATPYLDDLRQHAASLGIRDDMVQFHVGVADAALLIEYSRARLFISGSYTECQPLVLLDAMSTGTPFVARATGCIAWMPGGQAVSTPTDASYEIDRLLTDSDRWTTLSRQGREAAATTYAIDRNVDRLLAVLEGRSAT